MIMDRLGKWASSPFFACGFLIVLCVITRIPFAASYLLDWDSANYALALSNYDIRLHQPHPPGYLLYVCAGRLVFDLTGRPEFSYVCLSIASGIVAVLCMWLLGKSMRGPIAGWIAALLLASNPIFWFYNESVAGYSIDCAASIVFAYWAWRAGKEARPLEMLALGAAWAVAGGFRQSLMVFLAPLFLWTLIRSRAHIAWKCVSGAAAVVPALLITGWMAGSAGGWASYLALNREMAGHNAPLSSLLYGAGWSNAGKTGLGFAVWTIMAGGSCFLVYLLVFRVGRACEKSGDQTGLFLTVWLAPAMVFHALINMVKAGYALTYTPALILSAAVGFAGCAARPPWRKIPAFAAAAALVAVQAGYFLFVRPVSGDWIEKHWGLHENSFRAYALNSLILRFSAGGLAAQDAAIEEFLQKVGDSPENAILLAQGNWQRMARFYFPERATIGIANEPPHVFIRPAMTVPGLRFSDLSIALPKSLPLLWIANNAGQLPGHSGTTPRPDNPYSPSMALFNPRPGRLESQRLAVLWQDP